MRITVQGWGRNHGEAEIVKVALGEGALAGPGSHWGYWRVENEPEMAKAKLSACTEPLRLGGRYLLRVELSREEIAKLFFATHNGDLVQTFKSLLEDEERQAEEEEQRREAEQRAAMLAQRQRLAAQRERQEMLKQFGEKFASLNKRDGTARATSEAEPE
jgi:hypothetical protein